MPTKCFLSKLSNINFLANSRKVVVEDLIKEAFSEISSLLSWLHVCVF